MKKHINHYDMACLAMRAYTNQTFVTSEVEAHHQVFDNYQTLAFRGTEAANLWPMKNKAGSKQNWIDILNDFRFFGTSFNGFGRIHRGFFFGAKRWVNDHAKHIDPIKPLYITGHSKGAADGVQSARLLKYVFGFDNIAEVVLFGEPPSHYWGSRKHYDSLNIPTTTYRYGKDVVTYTPPWGRHSAKIVKIGEKSRFLSFEDHMIQCYMQALEEIVHGDVND